MFQGARKNTAISLSKIVGFEVYKDGIEIDKEPGKDMCCVGAADWARWFMSRCRNPLDAVTRGCRQHPRPFRKPSGNLVARFEGTTIVPLGPDFDEMMAAQASPACDVRLIKGERTRRYYIRPGQNLSEWYCQVWFGKNQQLGDRGLGVVPAQRLLGQYQREIRELLADGWTVTEG